MKKIACIPTLIVIMVLMLNSVSAQALNKSVAYTSYRFTTFTDTFNGKERQICIGAPKIKAQEKVGRSGEVQYDYTCSEIEIQLWDAKKSFTLRLGCTLDINSYADGEHEGLIAVYKDSYLGYDNVIRVVIQTGYYECSKYYEHFIKIDGNKLYDLGWIYLGDHDGMEIRENKILGQLTISCPLHTSLGDIFVEKQFTDEYDSEYTAKHKATYKFSEKKNWTGCVENMNIYNDYQCTALVGNTGKKKVYAYKIREAVKGSNRYNRVYVKCSGVKGWINLDEYQGEQVFGWG